MKSKFGCLTMIRGIAQIPLIVGLLLMAVAIPVATRLSQESAENRGRVTYCSTGSCNQNQCYQGDSSKCCCSGYTCTTNNQCVSMNPTPTPRPRQNCTHGSADTIYCYNGQACGCNGATGVESCSPCTYGCNGGHCNPNPAPTLACSPLAIRCNGDHVVQCLSDGSGEVTIKNCPCGCSGSDCRTCPTATPVPPTSTPRPVATNTPRPTATTAPCVAIGGTTSSEANCCSKKAVNMGGSVWQCACIPAGGTTTNANYCCSGKSENGKCLAPGCSLGGVYYAVGVKLCYADKSKYRSCASTGWQDVSCGNGTACYDDGAGNVGCATRQTAVCCCTSSNSQRSWYTSACPDYHGWYQCDGRCSSLPTPTPSYCGFVGLPCCNGNSCSGSICDTSTGKCRVIEDPTTFPTNCLSKYSVNQRVCDPLRPQYYNTCLSTGFWSGFIKCIAGTKCNEGVCESCIEDGSLCTAGLFNNCEKCCSNKYHSVSDKNYCGAVPTLVPTKTPVPTSTPTPTPAPGCKNDGVYCVIAGTVNTCNCCTNQYYRAGLTGDAYICGPRPTPTCIADGLSCGGSAASYCDRCCQKDVHYALGQNWFCGTNPNLTPVPTRLPTSSPAKCYCNNSGCLTTGSVGGQANSCRRQDEVSSGWRYQCPDTSCSGGQTCIASTTQTFDCSRYNCCPGAGYTKTTIPGTMSPVLCKCVGATTPPPGATAIPTAIPEGEDCPAGSFTSCLGKKIDSSCGTNLKCVIGASGKCECRNPAYLTQTPTPRPTRPPTTGMPTQAPGDKCYCIDSCSLSAECGWFNPTRVISDYNRECTSTYCTTPRSTPRPTVVIPSVQPTAIPTQPLVSPGQACRNDADCGAPTKPGCAVQCVTAYCPGNSGCGKTEGTNGAINCQLYPPTGTSWNADYSACVGAGIEPTPIASPPPPPPTGGPVPPTCQYDSLQARVQKNSTEHWQTQLTINKGEKVNLGCMYNGSGQLADNVKIVAKKSGGNEISFDKNLVIEWVAPEAGTYSIWCRSTNSNCQGLVSNSNATLTVGSMCKECPNEFRCYGPADDKVELGYAWFATGYVMEGWVAQVPDQYCVEAGKTRPTWLGKAMGDANCDGKINTWDFSLWNKEYVESGATGVVKNSWEADFTGPDGKCDGLVNTYDFSLWNRSFTQTGGGN